ncbi:hypothetical protein OKW37_001912 [Paraburkholderia sp. MM5482-R2]
MRFRRAKSISRELARRRDDARVVDERIDAAEGLLQRIEHDGHVGFVRDIAGDRHRAAARVFDLCDRLLRGGEVTHVVHADAPAARAKQTRGGTANAAAAAGDQNSFRHRNLVVGVVRARRASLGFGGPGIQIASLWTAAHLSRAGGA